MSRSPPPSPLDLQALVRIVRDAAQPLLPGNRRRFLERVDALLREEGGPIGEGTIGRAVRRAQREFLSIPDAPAATIDGRR
jgi:hypothetical protein